GRDMMAGFFSAFRMHRRTARGEGLGHKLRKGSRMFRPRLELLEDRCLLDATWTGNGDGHSWRDGLNWNTGNAPMPTETATIAKAGADVHVTVSTAVKAVTVGSGTLTIDTGQSLTVQQDADISSATNTVLGTMVVGGNYNVSGVGEALVSGELK